MLGNRGMIKINIYMQTNRICYKSNNIFYNHCENFLKYYRSNVELKSTALFAVPIPKSSSSRHVD